MAKNGTEFSKYAQAFYEVIDGRKTDLHIFTKDLLKMGLTDNDKAYIDEAYPTIIDENGERHIAGNKGDTLRKYFRGTNNLSRLIPKLETEFDEEFRKRYCDELQDYDESRTMAFAQVLNIDVSEDDIDIVSEAIAEYYASIVIGLAIKKSRKGKKDKDDPESDRHKILLPYTLAESEKQALINICGLLKDTLKGIKSLSRTISDKQHELTKLNDSEKDNRWKKYLEAEISSYIRRLDKSFAKLEQLCADLSALLAPKRVMDEEYAKLNTCAINICNDRYKSTCHAGYDFDALWRLISQFDKSIDNVLSAADKG